MTLYPYQQKGVEWLRKVRSGILADDMGLGKTVQLIAGIEKGKVLVICPGVLRSRWQTGFREQLGIDIPFVFGNKGGRMQMIREAKEVLIISFDTLRTEITDLLNHKFDYVIIDEGHRLKNRNSKTFKAAQRLRSKNPNAYWWIATGTPIRKHASDIWSLLHLCYPKTYRSYWKWVETHFRLEPIHYGQKTMMAKKICECRDLEKLSKELEPYLLRRTYKDIRNADEIPLVQSVIHKVPLEATQLKAYKDLVVNWKFTRKETDQQLLVASAVELQLRLRQVCISPGIILKHDLKDSNFGKFLYLDELLDINDDKWLIVSSFRGTIELLQQRYGKQYGVSQCVGGMTQEALESEKGQFLSGQTRIFAGTAQSMSEGLDKLQTVCHNVAFMDLDWIPSVNQQVIGRIHRLGQINPNGVFVHYLLCDGTLEDKIFARVEARKRESLPLMPYDELIELLDQEAKVLSSR